MIRRDTTLQAEGAEYLVLGELLIRGIEVYKAYARNKGHDLVAVRLGRSITIQVKSRRNSERGVYMRNFESDFFVFVMLNRHKDIPPVFYVLPTSLAKKYIDTASGSKFKLSRIPDIEQYQNAWRLINQALE